MAEVEFAERTDDGVIRQGSFMGLREDMPAKSGRRRARAEAAGGESADQDHPSGSADLARASSITKADLARYYAEVATGCCRTSRTGRSALVRCPDGVEAKCFYQRHLGMGASPGDLKTFERVRSSKGKYLYLDSKDGMLSAVQNGAVEFHTWGASVPDPKHPDRITMDLDPGPGVNWSELVKATLLTRTLLEKLGLKCFLKTTGGKGLHVVAPIEPRSRLGRASRSSPVSSPSSWSRQSRQLFIAKMSKAKRSGKVFVDYLRNSETASAVSAYSARARKEAGVSTPLEWDELGRADIRGRFTVQTVPKRLAKLTLDPWAEYGSTRQSITKAMQRALQLGGTH